MPEAGRSRTLLWIFLGCGALAVFFFLIFSAFFFGFRGGNDEIESEGGGEKIAVIDVDGVILEAKPFVDDLRRYADDSSIHAIILRIDSPGGGAAASQEMYDAVRRVRDQKKKLVVASIQTVGASGAYYICSGASKIYANRASIVGSIGVIAEWVNYGDLLHWAKLKEVIFTAGALKDTGDPAREMTPEERVYMQSLIDEMYGQFVHDVADGRKLKVEDVKSMASGRVWTGEQALPLKLIDKLGGFEDAVDDTARAVGIKGEPTLVRPARERHSLFDILLGDVDHVLPSRLRLLQRNTGFYYLWRQPGRL